MMKFTNLPAILSPFKPSSEPSLERDEYQFMPAFLDVTSKPPSPWARRTAFAVTSLLVLTIVWSIVGKLDIHASATGRLMVSSHSKVIQPLEQGEITHINVRDGQSVTQGEILIQLNPTGADAEYTRLAQQLLRFELEQARLLALLCNAPLESFAPPTNASQSQQAVALAYLKSEIAQTQASLLRLNTDIDVNNAQQQANLQDIQALTLLKENIQERLNARTELIKTQAISKVNLLEQQKELLEVERDIINIVAQNTVLVAQIASLKQQQQTVLAQKSNEYHQALETVNANIHQTEQEHIKASERLRIQAIKSPVSGVVQQLAVHTLGGVVTPAQALMVIVPAETSLEAEVMVLNKDIGFVVAGQVVEVKIDSFPFTKYGTISGKVLHVSGDAMQDEQLGLVFPARIAIDTDNMVIENERIKLSAGMSVLVEIKTGNRRVIEYLLSPLQQYQSEALRER